MRLRLAASDRTKKQSQRGLCQKTMRAEIEAAPASLARDVY